MCPRRSLAPIPSVRTRTPFGSVLMVASARCSWPAFNMVEVLSPGTPRLVRPSGWPVCFSRYAWKPCDKVLAFIGDADAGRERIAQRQVHRVARLAQRGCCLAGQRRPRDVWRRCRGAAWSGGLVVFDALRDVLVDQRAFALEPDQPHRSVAQLDGLQRQRARSRKGRVHVQRLVDERTHQLVSRHRELADADAAERDDELALAYARHQRAGHRNGHRAAAAEVGGHVDPVRMDDQIGVGDR